MTTISEAEFARIFNGIVEDRESTLWQNGPPIEGHVTAVEIDTGVIYAERVKAAWIEADRVYAQEVRIGQ